MRLPAITQKKTPTLWALLLMLGMFGPMIVGGALSFHPEHSLAATAWLLVGLVLTAMLFGLVISAHEGGGSSPSDAGEKRAPKGKERG